MKIECKSGNYRCGNRCVPNHWKCKKNRKNQLKAYGDLELDNLLRKSIVDKSSDNQELLNEYIKREAKKLNREN